MSILDHAIDHIRNGRPVFPGIPGEKIPAIKDPYSHFTLDEKQVLTWWDENPEYNILLPMGVEIEPGKFIGAIDFDLKDNRNGFETAEKLALIGLEFPETLEQLTPNNGIHKIYLFDFPIGNGVNLIGPGIDHRGYHGFVVGSGSWHSGKEYTKNNTKITQAPMWLAERCRRVDRRAPRSGASLSLVHGVEQEAASGRAIAFLKTLSPACQGERNQRGFEAACRLKDFGLLRENTTDCLATHWKAEPALEREELEHIVDSAYKYGQNEVGVSAPENAFEAIPEEKEEKPKNPIDEMSKNYALVVHHGVRIIREKDGRVDHLSVQSFHELESNNLIMFSNKEIQISKLWMKSKNRRQYEGIVFDPGNSSPGFFNVWRGFAVGAPKGEVDPKAQRAVDLFVEHIRENVCAGDEEHTRWVLGFFAHLIQKPEEKPRAALVLRGKKGVGKNVITECVGRLLGDHFITCANRRYLSGNFNSHLENKLLLVLDEAYWSGDKQTEGVLKDMITGSKHIIERKGHESYIIDNLLRVVIFGNEEWVVPATGDERRFAVFEVGDRNRQDNVFFGEIMDGMRDFGGDELLFKYLKEFDLSEVDLNTPPETGALMTQKEHTMGPVESWWFACLQEGEIIGAGLDAWPKDVPRQVLRTSFLGAIDEQKYKGRIPNSNWFGRAFGKMAPSCVKVVRKMDGDLRTRVQVIAPLDIARAEWEVFMNGKVEWEVV